MTTRRQSDIGTAWRRDKAGMGVWPHRGKVAIAGIGHSPVDRRYDMHSMDTTLGAYAILACRRAMADAGVKPEDVDGLLCCPQNGDGSGGPAGRWAPRPYFSPPYDSEDGLSIVTGGWLQKQMPDLKNLKYVPHDVPAIGEGMGFAAQSVAEGKCHTTLFIYTMGNLEGRYRQGGEENTSEMAKGNRQWTAPWGSHGGNMFINIFPHEQYNIKYGRKHDDMAPFVINQHRNGLAAPWGFYTNHEPRMTTLEDYMTSRMILNPLRIWDCDRPVNAVTAYLVTTSERAKNMRQKPVYILNHSQGGSRERSTHATLEEVQAWSANAARQAYEGSGLKPSDLDIFNPYDGYSTMTQFFLEAFQYKGVKEGQAYDFYKDIGYDGMHPFASGGGNLGNGRTRSAMYTDSVEQHRGRVGIIEGFDDPVKHKPLAGKRKVHAKAETAICGFAPTGSEAFLALSSTPS